MSRRAPVALALPVIAALSLTLTACGEQGSPTGQASAAQGEQPDAEDPIVVQIDDEEFATTMAIYRRYDEAKGGGLALRAPLAPAEEIDGGRVQEYTAGTVYWSPETGARIVRGQILATYLDNGGPTGRLGWPVTDETTEDELVYSEFQNGQIRLKDQAIQVVDYPG